MLWLSQKGWSRGSCSAWQGSPEGGAEGDVAHEDDVQQDEGSGEKPVHVAGVVDAAVVTVWVVDVSTAAECALRTKI